MSNHHPRGVTLLELIICLVIIALVSVAAAPLAGTRRAAPGVMVRIEARRRQAAREGRTLSIRDTSYGLEAPQESIQPTGRRLRSRYQPRR